MRSRKHCTFAANIFGKVTMSSGKGGMPSWASCLEGLHGSAHFDSLHCTLYATDASAYSERPMGVVYARDAHDVGLALRCALSAGVPLIPRAGGTSLAGQVVGRGLVVDISKHMRGVLEVNMAERWAWVEPGVVLDELNATLHPHGLFFSPETSTSNRCCIGGMVGNNSCGSHSVVYGSTRDHLLEARVMLPDGSQAHFRSMTEGEARRVAAQNDLEGRIYRHLLRLLDDPAVGEMLETNGPHPRLRRRNTGYALDVLRGEWEAYRCMNLCTLLAGSEGTLAFVLAAKVNLVPIPPREKLVVCVHCSTLEESFRANLVALAHQPRAVELIDSTILSLSRDNLAQRANRFFLEGEPAAVLVVELAEESLVAVRSAAVSLIDDLRAHGLGYAYPQLEGKDVGRVWSLRKAGLGILSTMPGDGKPVSLMEDTSVLPEYLESYIAEVKAMLASHGLQSVYHAHIAEGELHIRPVLNLKSEADRQLFRTVGRETALLVRKYRGSLSGEHGDGRLRGEFIPLVVGEEVYDLFEGVKGVFDPLGILNPNKIVRTPPMDSAFRYRGVEDPGELYFDYGQERGYVRSVEQCNGAGDCRKSAQWGGVMCPTFHATHDERYATRGRANALRTALYRDGARFDDADALAALDSCLACKGCKSECPSSVDMSRYKAEYLQHHYDAKGVPFASYLIARMPDAQRLAMGVYPLYNALVRLPVTSHLVARSLGFTSRRKLPTLGRYTLRGWLRRHLAAGQPANGIGKVSLFVDEFTNFLDVDLGIAFVRLLQRLGYTVEAPRHAESGRTALSKGMLRRARKLADRNVSLLSGRVEPDTPLVGIEPSCILAFRDEYPSLLRGEAKVRAQDLAANALLYDEFLMREVEAGRICRSLFGRANGRRVLLHGHCHQKALASVQASAAMLRHCGYDVEVLPTGCCGMAGAFGYERRHYELSQRVGEEVLFPAVRGAGPDTLIAAPGTSCRQQIWDGTGVRAYHPIELMMMALEGSNFKVSSQE